MQVMPHAAGRIGVVTGEAWLESGGHCHGGISQNPSKQGQTGVIHLNRSHSRAQDGAHMSASVSDAGCQRSDGLQQAKLVIHRRGGLQTAMSRKVEN
jgi:hypothetical protein